MIFSSCLSKVRSAINEIVELKAFGCKDLIDIVYHPKIIPFMLQNPYAVTKPR